MEKKNFSILHIFILCLTISIIPLQSVSASKSDIVVIPVLPDNQRNEIENYFDLMMKPAQEQVVEVELQNNSDTAVKVEAEICTAITNNNGVVEYGNFNTVADSSLKYNLNDIVTVVQYIVIPAGSSYMFQVAINMPEEEFEGVLAGGIAFHVRAATAGDEESGNETEVTETKKDMAETGEEPNKVQDTENYSYVVAVLIRENEETVTPSLILTDISANQNNADNVITTNIQNIEAAFVSQGTIDAYVCKKGSSEILYESHNESIQIAPNSNFDYLIASNGQKLESGEYTIRLEINSENNHWIWEKDFTIDKETVESLEDSNTMIQTVSGNSSNYIIIAVMAAVLCVTAIGVIVGMRRKQKKEEALLEAMKSLIKSIGD